MLMPACPCSSTPAIFLEHVPKKLLLFRFLYMLQLFDFEHISVKEFHLI